MGEGRGGSSGLTYEKKSSKRQVEVWGFGDGMGLGCPLRGILILTLTLMLPPVEFLSSISNSRTLSAMIPCVRMEEENEKDK